MAVTKTVKDRYFQRVGGCCEPILFSLVPIPSEPEARKAVVIAE